MSTFTECREGSAWVCRQVLLYPVKTLSVFFAPTPPPPPPEVLLGILGRGVPLRSPNPDPTSDQNMSLSTPVFRPDL